MKIRVLALIALVPAGYPRRFVNWLFGGKEPLASSSSEAASSLASTKEIDWTPPPSVQAQDALRLRSAAPARRLP